MVAAAVVASAAVGAVASSAASNKAAKASKYAVDSAASASERQADLAEKQYKDYQEIYEPLVLQGMRDSAAAGKAAESRAQQQFDFQSGESKRMADRYWGTQVPVEDRMIQDAMSYNSEDERERMAGIASADVNTAFDDAAGQSTREMARMGVNINSGRFAALKSGESVARAAALSSAKNKTREAAKQLGWTRMGEVSALGKGLPGFSAGSSQIALGWSGAGLNAGQTGLNAVMQGSGVANGSATTTSNLWGGSAATAGRGFDAYNAALGTSYKDPFISQLGSFGGMLSGYAGQQLGLKLGKT